MSTDQTNDTTPPAPDTTGGVDPLQVTQTAVSKRWMRKSVIFLLIFLVLGVWGLVDALVVYPNAGKRYEKYARLQYLAAANEAGSLANSSITDPAAVLKDLTGRPASSKVDAAKLDWLTSLDRVGMLAPTNTTFPNPATSLKDLAAEIKSTEQPQPLNAWDIPFQWIITGVGALGALWVLFNIARTKATKYNWDPSTATLTLADGKQLKPADIAEFDKRKWHKFFVTLVTTAGTRHEIDLYKHDPLEEWILEMENIRFPEPVSEASSEAAAS